MNNPLSPETETEEMLIIQPSPPMEAVTPFRHHIRKRRKSLPPRTQYKRICKEKTTSFHETTACDVDLLHKIAKLENIRSSYMRHLDAVIKEKQEQATTLHVLIASLQSKIQEQKTELETTDREIKHLHKTNYNNLLTIETLKQDYQQCISRLKNEYDELKVEKDGIEAVRACDLQHIANLQKESWEFFEETKRLQAKEEANNSAFDERIAFLTKAHQSITWHQQFSDEQAKNQATLLTQMQYTTTGFNEQIKRLQDIVLTSLLGNKTN